APVSRLPHAAVLASLSRPASSRPARPDRAVASDRPERRRNREAAGLRHLLHPQLVGLARRLRAGTNGRRRGQRPRRLLTLSARARIQHAVTNSRKLSITALEDVVSMGLTGLILVLHVYRAVCAGGFWRDEIGTLTPATQPTLSALWAKLDYSTPPALPYVAVRLWTTYLGFGTSDASLRVFGLLGGLTLLAAIWWASRLAGMRRPMLLLAFFAANGAV